MRHCNAHSADGWQDVLEPGEQPETEQLRKDKRNPPRKTLDLAASSGHFDVKRQAIWEMSAQGVFGYMTDLPIGLFIFLAVVVGLMSSFSAKLMWFERIHGLSRWWVSAYPTILFTILLAAFLSFLVHYSLETNLLEALLEDPRDGFLFLIESGAEIVIFAIILIPITIIYLEVGHWRRKRKNGAIGLWNSRKFLTGMAVLTSAIFFVAATLSNIQNPLVQLLLAPLAPLLPAFAVSYALQWCINNPTARLHEMVGIQRVSLVSTAHGLIWLPSFLPNFSRRLPEPIQLVSEIGVALLAAFAISGCTWLAVNILGWLLEGFSKKNVS